MSPDGALEAIRLTHRFSESSDYVLKKVSLKVRRGAFVGVIGPSGCGKTTLLSSLAGLLRPESGHVLVDGEDVTGRPNPQRAVVFQSDHLFPWRTALANVTFSLIGTDLSRAERIRRAEVALNIVGLGGFREFFPAELSGGMRQRVNVARAIVLEPEFLLMDEPFAALDAQTRELMQEELLKIWGRSQAGAVFVTHQLDEALFLSDYIVVMRDGAIVSKLEVPFERPRRLDIKRSSLFQSMYAEVWSTMGLARQ